MYIYPYINKACISPLSEKIIYQRLYGEELNTSLEKKKSKNSNAKQ